MNNMDTWLLSLQIGLSEQLVLVLQYREHTGSSVGHVYTNVPVQYKRYLDNLSSGRIVNTRKYL